MVLDTTVFFSNEAHGRAVEKVDGLFLEYNLWRKEWLPVSRSDAAMKDQSVVFSREPVSTSFCTSEVISSPRTPK